MTPRTSPAHIAITTGFLWLGTGIAATALWPVYQSPAVIVLVAVALALGSLIAILGAVLRWPSPVVLLATIAGFLLVGVPVAVPSKAQAVVLPTPGGLLDLVTGVALGWRQLLTITLPVGDYQALLVPALVLILVPTVLGLSVALRTRVPELVVLAPVAVFLTATAFGPQYPDRPLLAPIALLVTVLFWLVWLRWVRRRRAIRLLAGDDAARPEFGAAGLRTVVSAALIMAIAAGSAVAAAAAAPPEGDRSVLRTAVQQPFDPRDYVSPLAGYRAYWQPQTRDSVLFDVTGLPAGGRLRLATLDTYDGVVYTVGSDRATSESGSFTRVPSTFDQSAVDGQQVAVDVTVGDYSGVWMPTAGQFESVRFAGAGGASLRERFFYNDASGTAAVLGGLGSGDAYSLTAVLPAQPADSELAALEPGRAIVPSPPEAPSALTARLEQYTRGLTGAGERLQAALAGLAADGYISHGVADTEPPSRSGHAIDRIAQLFEDPLMLGDAEQYAVAAALMADQLGFPARVVVGFVPDGTRVRGSDATVWLEVDTAQYGWVALDPVPPLRDIPTELPQESTQVSRPLTVVPPPVVDDAPADRQRTPESEQEQQPQPSALVELVLAVLRIAGLTVLGALLLLAPFLLVVAAKLRRRRLRRRAATPADRIVGGWREFEDAVLDHGFAPAPAATRTEVAGLAGGTQSLLVAAVADRANFAPDEPEPAEADAVWRAVDDLRWSLDRGRTRWQRLKARVSVRSLRAYSVSKLFKR